MFDNIKKRLIEMYNGNNTVMSFETRSLWHEIEVHPSIVNKRFVEYLGEEDRKIRNRDESLNILGTLINKIQSNMKNRIKETDTRAFITELQRIFSIVYGVYIEQKKDRIKIKSFNINNPEITELFEVNKQISKCIIDGVSVWIENATIYQKNIEYTCNNTNKIDIDLLVDTYIYGLASMNFSLLNISKIKNFGAKDFYYGLDLTPNEDIPIRAYRHHPITYHNPIILGNQDNLYNDFELANSDDSEIGRKFKDKYGLSYLRYIAILNELPKSDFKNYMTKDEFYISIKNLGVYDVNPDVVYNNLTLKKEDIATHLRDSDEFIWTIETNEHRISLKPFIRLESGHIMTNAELLERAKHTWISYLLNGGQVYSNNQSDDFLKVFECRNKELSNRLVELLRNILRNNYKGTFDEVEVPCSMIWNKREIDYGDFDLMFYSKGSNELFLIEAKYICDSLNASGIVSDYDKMFKDKGYIFRCRRRYDLVKSEPDKLKEHIGVEGEINIHFLFITSKPLEIEIQDKDDIVTFVSLEMFDAYIKGKYESEYGERIVRPISII